jgi:stage III sporulation protein AD
MLILKIAASVLILCLLFLLLKKDRPELAFLLALAGTAALITVIVHQASPLLRWVKTLCESAQGTSFTCLLQVLGIAVITQYAADTCTDAGLMAAASAVQFCGRILAVVQVLPLLQKLLDAFLSFLQ